MRRHGFLGALRRSVDGVWARSIQLRFAADIHDPIDFPSLPAVERESLLPARSVPGDMRPGIANAHRFAILDVFAKKLAHTIVECADNRCLHDAGPTVDPIDRPLPGLGIEKAQGQSRPAFAGEFNLIDVADATQDGSHDLATRKL